MKSGKKQWVPMKKSSIEVIGNKVYFKTEIIENYCSLKEFVQELWAEGDIVTPILPENCVYYNRSDKVVKLIIQLPPNVMNIKYILSSHNVSLPWLYFIFTLTITDNDEKVINIVKGACSPVRINNISDKVYEAILPNVNTDNNGDWSICFAHNLPDDEGLYWINKPDSKSLIEVVNEAMGTYFDRDSNGDYGWKPLPGCETIEEWEELTKKNISCSIDKSLPWDKLKSAKLSELL